MMRKKLIEFETDSGANHVIEMVESLVEFVVEQLKLKGYKILTVA